MANDAITVYADYACPFCYLGHASLSTYREARDEPLVVEWHPFDLLASQRNDDGEIVRQDPKDDSYYEQAWKNVQRLADEYDVPVPDEPITDTDSLLAQQVSLYVRENHPDAWSAFDRGLYHAVWRDERDVSDPAVLKDVADDTDLDPTVVDEALAADDLRDRLREAFGAARQRGVTGVPTFVHDGRATQGAVPPAQLRRLIEGSN